MGLGLGARHSGAKVHSAAEAHLVRVGVKVGVRVGVRGATLWDQCAYRGGGALKKS